MRRRAVLSLLCLALGASVAGCQPPAPASSADPYRPTPARARAALLASLQAWLDGHSTGSITSATPRVETSDSYRSPDRPLRSFEILGPVGTDDLRQFAVRLSLGNSPEDQTVRYVIVGTNPIWVFRAEDYERISHWEHKMEEARTQDEPPANPEP